MNSKQHYYILVAEDDLDDCLLIREAMESTGAFSRIEMVRDGQELLDFIGQNKPLPDLILSDINMPRKDGLEVLAILKNDTVLKQIPFVIFSTSKSPTIKEAAALLGAEAYYTKPDTFSEYSKIMESILSTVVSVSR